MKHILVPIDLTEVSANAASYAADLAKQFQATIHLLHVVSPTSITAVPHYGTVAAINSLELTRKQEKIARESVQTLAKTLRTKYKNSIPITSSVQVGEPVREILEQATTIQPDLILIGINPKTTVERVLFGSVAGELIGKTEIPILGIPEEATYQGINRILYASDFDPSDHVVFKQLIQLLNPKHTNFYCCHIVNPDEDPNLIEMTGLMEKVLKVHIPNEDFHQRMSYDVVLGENVSEGLDYFIDENYIHLLAVSTHKRNFIQRMLHPSITKKILFHTRTPLLIFHAEES